MTSNSKFFTAFNDDNEILIMTIDEGNGNSIQLSLKDYC